MFFFDTFKSRQLIKKEFPGSGSFQHGIHPPDNKHFSGDCAIEVPPQPDVITLPLLQNIGAPCEPIVKPKQHVTAGEQVARGRAFISAPLHSPITGIVQKMTMTTLPNGMHLPAMRIKADGDQLTGQELYDDIFGGAWPTECPDDLGPKQIADAIYDAGIVGLGGAAFPTHVKMLVHETRMIDSLIINGCECEPYLTSDYRLMVEAPATVISGALMAGRATEAKEIIICIEDNKPRAIQALREMARDTVIKIAVVKTKYPQGSEKQLIKAVLNLEVPLGGLPSDVGVAMSNVGTIAAIARGVLRGKPLTHRVISVSGAGVQRPKNLLVPIGVRIGDILAYCGGLTPDAARIIAGGPLMGFSFSNLDTPVTKGTSGITVLSQTDAHRKKETACIRCGQCVDACPMNLVPTKLAMAARYQNTSLAVRYNITACFECGCCTYVCPANIKLVQLIRTGKRYLQTKRQK